MRCAWLVLALLSACGFQVSGGVSGDGSVGGDDGGSGSDAGSGGGSDAGAGSDATVDPAKCFGGYRQICLQSLPTTELHIFAADNGGSNNFDTGSDPRCVATTNSNTEHLCVMVGTSITIDSGAILRAHSSAHPLVLIATSGAILISGTIDVSSHVGTNQGAGANGNGGAETCNAGMAPSFAGGGQGGSFGSIGGDGGDSATASFTAVGGNHGGIIPFGAGMLRGGCRGADGAKVPTSNGVGGPGGNSGGAVLIIGTSTITMSGVIDASGSGGQGGSAGANTMVDSVNRGGGGGGGSGGMIVIDVPTVTISGRLWSEGGGGGEGGGTQVGGNGTNGTPAGMAPGGTGHDGGDGGAGSQGGGAGFIGSDGGQTAPGGGGGGGGFNYTTAANATINAGSSPPVAHP